MHHFTHSSNAIDGQFKSRCQYSPLTVCASLLLMAALVYISWISPFWSFILVAFLVVEWQARADLQAAHGSTSGRSISGRNASRRNASAGSFIAMLSLIDDDYFDYEEELHGEYNFHKRHDF